MHISLLLPPNTRTETFEIVWNQINGECKKLEISIVGGHTGVYPGIGYPLNGGCVMIGFCKKRDLRPASNAKAGGVLLITKGAAIEAAGILAYQAEGSKKICGSKFVEDAKRLFFKMRVVEDVLTSARYRHTMHDTTEGGFINAIYEVAEDSDFRSDSL